MNKQYPFVSIIIVNYRRKELTKTCLDSVFAIDYPSEFYEVILVDNCSQDGSVVLIDSLFKGRVRIIENQVNNYCQACNLGIAMSKGIYVVLLNNDVEVSRRWLTELVAVAERDLAARSSQPGRGPHPVVANFARVRHEAIDGRRRRGHLPDHPRVSRRRIRPTP